MLPSAPRSLLFNQSFMALCAARFVSGAGDNIAAVALVLLIARNGPATAVGGLLLAESVPLLAAAHTGALADRFERRRLMIGCQLAQALIFGLLTVWLPPYGALLALITSATLVGTLLGGATQTAVRALVSEEQLLAANGMIAAALSAALVAGPAIGGALAGLAGPRTALAADTATFLGSAVTLRWLPPLSRLERTSHDSGTVSAAQRFVARDRVLRWMIPGLALLATSAGVDSVAMVFLVRETLGGGSATYGVAAATVGAGVLLGTGLTIGIRRWSAEQALQVSVLGTAAGSAGVGLAPALGWIFPFLIMSGSAFGVQVAARTTLVQRRAPPAMLGRISGVTNAAIAGGYMLAYAGGGLIVDMTSPRLAFLVAAAAACPALLLLMPARRPTSARDEHGPRT